MIPPGSNVAGLDYLCLTSDLTLAARQVHFSTTLTGAGGLSAREEGHERYQTH
jgi:hypothetical protein